MDAVYKSDKSYSLSTNISEYFSNDIFNKFISPKFSENCDKSVLELMEINVTNDEFQSLKINCGVDNLKCDDDLLIETRPLRDTVLRQDFPNNLTHVTLKKLHSRCAADRDYRYRSKLKHIREVKCPPKKFSSSDPPDIKPGKEIVLTIIMYAPFVHNTYHNDGYLPYFNRSVNVLGSQKISTLMKMIACSNNSTMRNIPEQDFIKEPSKPENYLTQRSGSGFVFIEDTFYNNFSHPDNIDYSKVIIDWAKKREGMGPFKTANMDDVLFRDLTVRLGFPQVIQHQGNCEHLFVISNIRLLSHTDVCYSSYYPITVSIPLKKSQPCYVCKEFASTRIVYESDRTAYDPCLFCENCFISFNYIGERPVSKFKAYTYQNMQYALHVKNSQEES